MSKNRIKKIWLCLCVLFLSTTSFVYAQDTHKKESPTGKETDRLFDISYEEKANTFKDSYRNILSLTSDLVEKVHKENIKKALNELSSYEEEVKKILSAEETLLKSLLHQIYELEAKQYQEKYQNVFNKQEEEISVEDRDILKEALIELDTYDLDVQTLLSDKREFIEKFVQKTETGFIYKNIHNKADKDGKEADQLLSPEALEELQKEKAKPRAQAFLEKYKDILALTFDTVSLENMDQIGTALKELHEDYYVKVLLKGETDYLKKLYLKLFAEKYKDLLQASDFVEYMDIFKHVNVDFKNIDYERLVRAFKEYLMALFGYEEPPYYDPDYEKEKSPIKDKLIRLKYRIDKIKEEEEYRKHKEAENKKDAEEFKKIFKEALENTPKEKILVEKAIYEKDSSEKISLQDLLDYIQEKDSSFRKLIEEEEKILKELIEEANNWDKVPQEKREEALRAEKLHPVVDTNRDPKSPHNKTSQTITTSNKDDKTSPTSEKKLLVDTSVKPDKKADKGLKNHQDIKIGFMVFCWVLILFVLLVKKRNKK